MPGNSWPALLIAAIALVLAAWLLLRAQNSPSLPADVAGIRLEVTAPLVVEDRVLEQLWEVPVVLTNTTRRPRPRSARAHPARHSYAQISTGASLTYVDRRSRKTGSQPTVYASGGLRLNHS